MFPILFEDADILAINKPEGIATIPESGGSNDDILTLLSTNYSSKLYVVHRLDKDVSGVLLFAKTAGTHKYLNAQFLDRKVKKSYLALTHGEIRGTHGVIDQPIRKFGSGRMGVDRARGKPSTTNFQVKKRLSNYTLVNVHPLTGRRHQIRVHFYSLGHPIVGDQRYGDRTLQRLYPRLMLHASEVAVNLPSLESLIVAAPIPESFRSAQDKIKNDQYLSEYGFSIGK
jgi:RluA family pseudouridine synthase